jgi:hypothetical protein
MLWVHQKKPLSNKPSPPTNKGSMDPSCLDDKSSRNLSGCPHLIDQSDLVAKAFEWGFFILKILTKKFLTIANQLHYHTCPFLVSECVGLEANIFGVHLKL